MINKIIKIILLFVVILTIFSTYNVQAIQDPLKDPNAYDDVAKPEDNDNGAIMTMGGKVLGIINIVGVVVSVIVLMIIGIKYMLGSIEEKAEYKKSMTGYVIGAIMLFGITTIANILYKIGTSI